MLWFMRRPLSGYDLQQVNFLSTFNALTFLLPLYALIPLFVMEAKGLKRIARWWQWSCSKAVPLLYIGVFLCLALTVLKVPGLGWTWMTVGLMFLLLIAVLSSSRMSKGEAFVLGIGIMSFAMGAWEIPFRIIAYHFYGSQYWPALPFLTIGITAEIPNLLGGLFIMWFYNRKYRLLHFNLQFWTCLAVYCVLWAVWIGMGFWMDPVWNGQAIVYNPTTSTSYFQNMAYKGTKVFLNFLLLFGFAGLTHSLKTLDKKTK
jgi:hypothetical protein